MRVKVYLNQNRDLELIAIMYDPALNFGNIAKKAVAAHVRGKKFEFDYQPDGEYSPKSLVCYISFDDEEDADIIEYMNRLNVPMSAFIRNVMLRSLGGKIDSVYTDVNLKKIVTAWTDQTGKKAKKKEIIKKELELDELEFRDKINSILKRGDSL